MDSEDLDQTTQISLHSVRNLLGSEQQLSLFNEDKVKEFAETYGVSLDGEISRYGIDLTDIQLRMMEGILHGLTKTRYKGNLEPVDIPAHAKEKYPRGDVPDSYKYVERIPKFKATQSEILRWANVNQKSAGEVQVALKAFKHLGTNQYCFFYTRLAMSEDGTPKKERDGEFQKEEVIAVDTLFTIKEVRSKKTGLLNYYEIIPSSIFLDQRESYFMLIPFNWREEVRGIIGQRKASSYTFRFLLLLRYIFEMQRRSRKDFVIRCHPEEMAIKLKMPESVYRRKKDRANKILDDAYSVAKRLGYLKKYERTPVMDILYLNEEKYYLPRGVEKLPPTRDDEDPTPEMKVAKEILDLMIQERRKLTPTYNPISGGHIRENSLNHLAELLKDQPVDQIKQVIVWGINKTFWCTQIGTPSRLRKNYFEALTEMLAEQNKGSHSHEKVNREWASDIARKFEEMEVKNSIRVELLNKHIEIAEYGSSHADCIDYSDKNFKDRVENALRKRGVSFGVVA
jgi:hypothetical protein